MTGAPLLDYISAHEARYPQVPGSKERGGASEAAAEFVKSRVQRAHESILELLSRGDLAPFEIVAALGADNPTFWLPRVSELVKKNLIHKTSERRFPEGCECFATCRRLGPKPPIQNFGQAVIARAA